MTDILLNVLKLLSPVSLVLLGWLLGAFDKLVSARRERRRALGCVLTDLLEIRVRLVAAREAVDVLSKHFALPPAAKPELQSLFRRLLIDRMPDWRQVQLNDQQAVRAVAASDPLLAFQLRNKDQLESLLALVKSLVVQAEEEVNVWPQIESLLVESAGPTFEDAIRLVAWRHGVLTYVNVRRHLKRRLDIVPEVNSLISKLKEVATAEQQSSSPTTRAEMSGTKVDAPNKPNESAGSLPEASLAELREGLRRAHEVGYGFPHEWPLFAERNRSFVDAYPELMLLVNRIFSPAVRYTLKKPSEVISFSLLSIAQEDFQQILCLATNAHGAAAHARVRTMFERIVLAAYFMKHPEQAEAYVYFEMVGRQKTLVEALAFYSEPKYADFRQRLDGRIDELNKSVDKAKQQHGKEFSKRWVNAGFNVLSKEVGLEGHYLFCYLVPNAFVHATPSDVVARLAVEDRLYVQVGPDHVNADEALRSAHTLLAISFELANNLLSLNLGAEVTEIARQCVEMYQSKPTRLVI